MSLFYTSTVIDSKEIVHWINRNGLFRKFNDYNHLLFEFLLLFYLQTLCIFQFCFRLFRNFLRTFRLKYLAVFYYQNPAGCQRHKAKDVYKRQFLIRNLFEQVLKTNDSLHFAILTGCMRISKESIFTGLNNLSVRSVTDLRYDEYLSLIHI